jgi:uncharacterized protein YdaT
MPWTLERYPPAMQRLPLAVRLKAIEIANAMLAQGYEEGQAIRMAIAAARRWAWGIRDRDGAAPRRGSAAGAGRDLGGRIRARSLT